MSYREDRIKYLTAKAQRGVITSAERRELASLLGRNPQDFNSDEGLNTLIGIALVAIAIAVLSELMSKK
jgi:hypothetical protein